MQYAATAAAKPARIIEPYRTYNSIMAPTSTSQTALGLPNDLAKLAERSAEDAVTPLIAHLDESDARRVRQAWEFAHALYGGTRLSTGETASGHALGLLAILDSVRADAAARAAGVLFGAADLLARPEEQLLETFGPEIAPIALGVRQLARIGELTRRSDHSNPRLRDPREVERQVEMLRKMLLAFATDIRVVLVRLASRLQTLRHFAASKLPIAPELARESLDLYAPLANRLGVWQIKWELEDLSFRFIEPDTYKRIARQLDEKRVEREAFIESSIAQTRALLEKAGIAAEVTGRPKHIFSIVNKMRAKGLDFENLYDVRALRVIVSDEKACYNALSVIHGRWAALPEEFDDYISRPKPNGYRSLHTVVRDTNQRPFEVQIRTREMHRFAEYGVAAHWRYKESGSNQGAQGRYEEKIAWLRQLLAWKAEVADSVSTGDGSTGGRDMPDQIAPARILDEHIYVLTPHAQVIELTAGSTPVDFAYHLHTDVGHRCRGARVDGAMVPLNTQLKNGQTVEIIMAKPGSPGFGPSRDWLNAQLGFLASPRARAKVRQWFNALDLSETVAVGRALVEKTLQREGKTAVNLDELAQRLGFARTEELFAAVAKDEFSLRLVESAVATPRGAGLDTDVAQDEPFVARKSRAGEGVSGKGVLVVGVDALMTQLAKCCRPAPPDPIVGFVTRGRGVSIHRRDCANLSTMCQRHPERVIDTAWGDADNAVYAVDVMVIATDRQGLLRDISEVFSREKINVVGVNTESRKGIARMRFTAEVDDANQLQRALLQIREVKGVEEARRGAL
ncbi:MAG: bifunctional (p)ppGpp synthetase/guanosine-3',5'-bis(diphosphate) 3'-pyrophosphohydrolase [Burkholderiaceae bacterium]|jgi:GTP pyrophosphokinase